MDQAEQYDVCMTKVYRQEKLTKFELSLMREWKDASDRGHSDWKLIEALHGLNKPETPRKLERDAGHTAPHAVATAHGERSE